MSTLNGNPAGVLTRGIAAGVAGTGAMTAWQDLSARLKHAMPMDVDERFRDEEPDPWAKAPAPAQLAKRMIEAVTGRPVPPSQIHLLTNVVHWGYGTALGTVYALAHERFRSRPLVAGAVFGLGVWAWSYATLVPAGLYKPPWQYPAKTIAKDISYHLVYGTGTAVGYTVLERLAARR
jgi:hypothetical protein